MAKMKSAVAVGTVVKAGILLMFLAVFMFGAAVLTYTSPPFDFTHAGFEISASKRYTEREAAEAAAATVEYMIREFDGCRLTELSCGDDPSDYDNQLEYVNSLGSHNGKHYTGFIKSYAELLFSADDGGGRRKGETWHYEFYLAREENGGWEVVTFGY